jgi:peptide/nickel transport system permease protein
VPALVAGAVLVALVILSVGADVIRPVDNRTIDLGATLQAPSLAHPMGTDESGRDLLALVLRGMRVSLTVSLLAALVALVIGGALGLLAGAAGGRVDALVMRFVDFLSSQNHFLFGILLVVLFRPVLGSAGAVMLSVGLTHWTSIARIIRGELLSLRERPFVEAAVNGGAGRLDLIRRHYVPHVVPPSILGFILLFPHAIFHESALSFLGLGLPPHQASLGNIIGASQSSLLAGGWWASLFPGLVILLAVVSVGTLGEHLRDRNQPRWRSELEL